MISHVVCPQCAAEFVLARGKLIENAPPQTVMLSYNLNGLVKVVSIKCPECDYTEEL